MKTNESKQETPAGASVQRLVRWDLFRKGLLYHANYYDWPLSGVANFEGRRVWFECVKIWWSGEGDDMEEQRRFAIYNPPPEVWKKIDARHEAFQMHVGTHTDYVEGKRVHKLHPQAEWKRFYDNPPPMPEMRDEWIVGYADSSLSANGRG